MKITYTTGENNGDLTVVLAGKPAKAALPFIVENIEALGALVEQSAISDMHRNHSAASHRKQSTAQKVEEVRVCREAFAEYAKSLHKPSMQALILMWTAAGCVLATEYGLTWSVIPPLVGVAKMSVMGFLMGGVPLIASVVIERIAADTCERFEPMLKLLKGWHVFALLVAIHALIFLPILWANVDMIAKLALVREEVMKLLAALVGNGPVPEMNRELIRSAVLSLSLVAVIDAALILLKADRLTGEMLRFNNAQKELRQLDGQWRAVTQEASEAETDFDSQRFAFENGASLASELKRAYVTRRTVELAEQMAKQPPPLALADAVDAALRPAARFTA